MIEYFKNLLTKPQYQWTVLEGLAFAGLLIGIALIIGSIIFVVMLVREKVKRNKQIQRGGKDDKR